MPKPNFDKKILAYIIGVAIGDGNLSNPNGRATRLRITCDTRYPKLIRKFSSAIKKILPENKVSFVERQKTFGDISCYSNKWESWLGWKVGEGSKYTQGVSVPNWIKNNKGFSIECLRGLFETDGSIYLDRGYKMINFTTIIPNLAKDVKEIMDGLGCSSNIYKIPTDHKDKYVIRISKNSKDFIKMIKLNKD